EAPVPARPGWLTRRAIARAAVVLVLVIAGGFLLWRWRLVKPTSATAKSIVIPSAVPNAPVGGENLRMIVGSTTPYIDRSGRTWGPDRFFSGGSVLVRSSERIFRTLD